MVMRIMNILENNTYKDVTVLINTRKYDILRKKIEDTNIYIKIIIMALIIFMFYRYKKNIFNTFTIIKKPITQVVSFTKKAF